jgi:hypothetical protein
MQLQVYRRDNRKRDQRRWLRRLLRIGVMAGLAIGAVALYRLSEPILIAAGSVRDFVLENPYFGVHEIQVRGGDKVSGDEVAKVAGLRRGMNIWKVDPVSIEKKIAKHPWVRRVLVRREFPRRIVIDVEERTPKAIVVLKKLYYVDADGTVFKEVAANDSVQFPLLTGLRPEQILAPDPVMRKKIQEAMRLGELMAQRSHGLSEIRFEALDRLAVYTTEFPVALHMGWGNWDEKLERLQQLLLLWKGKEDRLASLDMGFRSQVVARLRRVPSQ